MKPDPDADDLVHPSAEEVALLRAARKNGTRPSAVVRMVIERHPDIGWGELMFFLMDVFGVSLGDVSCIGGWSPDGSGELQDEQIDAFLVKVL